MRHVAPTWSLPLQHSATAHVLVTDRSHGNLSTADGRSDSGELLQFRGQIVNAPWAWVTQVHGADVAVVRAPGDVAGRHADALCTTAPNVPLAIQAADCAPLGLLSPSGVVGVAHCGWRGLVAGVVQRTVDAMRDLGAGEIVAVVGPCIRPSEYEFGTADLELLTDIFGPRVASHTQGGAPALDLPAAVGEACGQAGVEVAASLGACTAANPDRYWSHRARGDVERQAMVLWIEPPLCSAQEGE